MKVYTIGVSEITSTVNVRNVKMIYEKDLETKLITDIQSLLNGDKSARLRVIVRSKELSNKLKLEYNAECEDCYEELK